MGSETIYPKKKKKKKKKTNQGDTTLSQQASMTEEELRVQEALAEEKAKRKARTVDCLTRC